MIHKMTQIHDWPTECGSVRRPGAYAKPTQTTTVLIFFRPAILGYVRIPGHSNHSLIIIYVAHRLNDSHYFNISIRQNLISEWRSEICRLVKSGKGTGHDGDLPFKLSLAQLVTTFVDLMVIAISHRQDASSLCLGCNQPGHKLEDCNCFVNYIVAEGSAQRNPQLKAQIANLHKQFCSRLNSASALVFHLSVLSTLAPCVAP